MRKTLPFESPHTKSPGASATTRVTCRHGMRVLFSVYVSVSVDVNIGSSVGVSIDVDVSVGAIIIIAFLVKKEMSSTQTR